ncbi:S8 family serine peptidase [Solitalea sp. MAHUQ-68]|uniref:S8 family serine peptidase n=1 Tax=Solitalea agri TaxID=2953739 RepID=A0A9X2F3I8_9SPHI|nr:S8 family serine peptidase [Solitalea agri]MCO4293580.1 S8 family serine peptidase [Solitalea agri]
MNRKIILNVICMMGLCSSAFAQKNKPKLPLNWHLLSKETDSVYGVGAERAYKELLPGKKSKKVVVAILDTGIDTLNDDLKNVLWTNKKEIPGNGIDDDKNGYVDDIHGWNFLGSKDGKQNIVDASQEADREYLHLLKKYNNDTTKITNSADLAYLHQLVPKLSVTRTRTHFELMKLIYESVVTIDSVVKAYYGTTNFTYEQVRDYKTDDPKLKRGQAWLAMEMYNLKGDRSSAAAIQMRREIYESVKKRLTEVSNLEITERSKVGDDPNDNKDHYYGNNLLYFPESGHGTHVAGIVGAQRNNSNDVKGIADNVELMTVRVVPQGDEYDKDIANGIRYAVDNGARIINMSFGKPLSPGKQWIDDAMKYAESKGVLLVHAAGNDSKNLDSICTYPTKHLLKGGTLSNYIVVGASTPNAIAANFSNYGKKEVDIFAPGVNILSTMVNNRSGEMQGTSMAAPVVSGVAALVWEYYPTLTAAQLKEVLLKSATDVKEIVSPVPKKRMKSKMGLLSVTGGIVNAYNAIKLAEEMSKASNSSKVKTTKK